MKYEAWMTVDADIIDNQQVFQGFHKMCYLYNTQKLSKSDH